MAIASILSAGLIAALGSNAWAQALNVNQVFVKNENTTNITDHPVPVPIAFSEGAVSVGQLPQIRAGNLTTQVSPTSFYKGGSVRTAVAWVLETLPAGAESIHTLGQGASPAFIWGNHIQDLLKNQNGKSLRVVSKDIKGGEYAVTLDIDGMGNCNVQNQNPPKFSSNCVLQLEDGPVRKVWEVRKRLEPLAGGVAEDLSYLFTSVFIVSAYSKANFVTVDHLLTNANNLDEDAAPAQSGGPINNGWKYVTPQHGAIFFTDAKIEVATPAGVDHSLYFPDSAILAPSSVDPASTPQNSTFWIMPADGETVLAAPPYSTGVSLASPSNYMAGGQSLLTRLVVSFSATPLTAHPIEESNISAGGPLKMYNQIDDMFFREIVAPVKLNPNVSYQAYALASFNSQKNLASQTSRIGRWGQGVYYSKDTGSGGFADGYHQESTLATRFLLSCGTRCAADYLRAMRFENYPSAEMTNHFVGYRGDEHPKANIEFYRNTAFESEANGTVSCSAGPYNPKDALGFCQNTMMPPGHRTDAQGRSIDVYIAQAGRTMAHQWTMREPSHLSAARTYYRFLFTETMRRHLIATPSRP